MELIKILNTRIDISGHYRRWCLFLCPYCLKLIELLSYVGIKQKSCGCITNKGINNPFYGKQHTEKARKNIGKNKKGIKRSEETKQKIKENHADNSGNNHPLFGIGHTKETKQKMKENHADYIMENNPNWQGGLSFLLYPPEFNKDLKQVILERDNYKCQNFNCEHKSTKLDTHHIDYNKQNNNPENFIILCDICHGKTKGKNNRQYFTEFYQNIMIGKIMEYLL